MWHPRSGAAACLWPLQLSLGAKRAVSGRDFFFQTISWTGKQLQKTQTKPFSFTGQKTWIMNLETFTVFGLLKWWCSSCLRFINSVKSRQGRRCQPLPVVCVQRLASWVSKDVLYNERCLFTLQYALWSKCHHMFRVFYSFRGCGLPKEHGWTLEGIPSTSSRWLKQGRLTDFVYFLGLFSLLSHPLS